MGFDLVGVKPTSEAGRVFMNNGTAWSQLVRFMETTTPDIASRCPSWFDNDGQGLDRASAVDLADRLQTEVASDAAAKYAQEKIEVDTLETCGTCHGYHVYHYCLDCDNASWARPTSFFVENLMQFIEFSRASGGFKIH